MKKEALEYCSRSEECYLLVYHETRIKVLTWGADVRTAADNISKIVKALPVQMGVLCINHKLFQLTHCPATEFIDSRQE